LLEMQFTKASAPAGTVKRRAAASSPVALRLNRSKLEARMKSVLVFTMLLLFAGCASENENPNPKSTGPTKAEVKARDEFAKNLPKPPER
jgi:hypothetical protein